MGAPVLQDPEARRRRGTASPQLHPQTCCHPLTPALRTGRAKRRVILVQISLGKAQRSDPSSNCRAPDLLQSLGSSREAEATSQSCREELGNRDAGSTGQASLWQITQANLPMHLGLQKHPPPHTDSSL